MVDQTGQLELTLRPTMTPVDVLIIDLEWTEVFWKSVAALLEFIPGLQLWPVEALSTCYRTQVARHSTSPFHTHRAFAELSRTL